MTEQEAIEQFKERLAIEDYKQQIPKYYEAMEIAVKSLEEIQRYRAICTLDECRAAVSSVAKEITMKQCRDLRLYIKEFTNGCMLTEDEYNAIILILGKAADRLEKEGRVRNE